MALYRRSVALHPIPLTTLNTGTASSSGEKLRFIFNSILKHRKITGSDKVYTCTITSDNEPPTILALGLLKNYVESVCCMVHTLEIYVSDIFCDDFLWPKVRYVVNSVTKHFNNHGKASALLNEKQLQRGVTVDRLD